MASLQRRQTGRILRAFLKYFLLVLPALLTLEAAKAGILNPAVPQDLRATPRQLAVHLRWNVVRGSIGYELQRAPALAGPYRMLPNVLPQLNVYNDFVGFAATNLYYRVRSIQTNGPGYVLPTEWSRPVRGYSQGLNTNQLLTEMQRASFDYFYDFAHPVSGLARASARRDPDICAIGASGMGFFNLGVGIRRGFITRREGAAFAVNELRFLTQKADRFHGAFPHFMNGRTGKVIPFGKYDDGADIVETAYLIQGVLFARQFFSGPERNEVEIRARANQLWRDVEWDWFVNKASPTPAIIWHWSPHYAFKKNLSIIGFNECQIVYVLALASPTHPIQPKSYWEGWESPDYGAVSNRFGIQVTLGVCSDVGPPLFFSQFSYLGLDPRQLTFQGRTYFQHFQDFCRVQILYAQSKAGVYKGYGPLWGITASAGPDGYYAFAPGLHDNGTLAPTASLSSMPYVPEESLACLMEMYQGYGSKLWGPFGFYDAFNFTRNWVSKTYLCIDEGPIAPMIENYRTGLCWRIFMRCPEIQPVIKMLNDGEALRYQKMQTARTASR